MNRCPKCRKQFFTASFKCPCGAVYKHNTWTSLFDLKTIVNMESDSFQNTYLYYIKDLPQIIKDEMGLEVTFKKYIGFKKIRTRKNQVVLIFRFTEKNESRYLAWNINNNMVFRCKTNQKETRAFIGEKEINNLEEWVRSLVGEQ